MTVQVTTADTNVFDMCYSDGGEGEWYFLIWATQVCVASKGMVFQLVINRV